MSSRNDQIAEKLFLEMQVALTIGESSRTIAALSGDFETSVRVLQGRIAFQKFDFEGHLEAKGIWTELRKKNPDSPLGPYLLGWIPRQRVILGVSEDLMADFVEWRRLATEALAMQEWGDPYTLFAIIDAAVEQYDEAIAAANRALALSPGGADVNALDGLALYNSGEAKRSLKHMLKGMRLEPDYPEWLPGALYPALMENGRLDETISLAKAVLKKEMRDARALTQARVALAAAYFLKGDLENARRIVRDEILPRKPDLTVEFLMTLGGMLPRVRSTRRYMMRMWRLVCRQRVTYGASRLASAHPTSQIHIINLAQRTRELAGCLREKYPLSDAFKICAEMSRAFYAHDAGRFGLQSKMVKVSQIQALVSDAGHDNLNVSALQFEGC